MEAATTGFTNLELSQIHENKIYLRNACIDGVKTKEWFLSGE